MTTTPTQEIAAAAALQCVGTKFHHQGRLAGVGLDCVGVLCHCFEAACGRKAEEPPAYREQPDPAVLIKYLRRNLIESAAPPMTGDVVLLWVRRPSMATHAGVLAPGGVLVHATRHGGTVAQSYDDWWRRRTAGVFRFPGVKGGPSWRR